MTVGRRTRALVAVVRMTGDFRVFSFLMVVEVVGATAGSAGDDFGVMMTMPSWPYRALYASATFLRRSSVI